MKTKSRFYYPATYIKDAQQDSILIPVVSALPGRNATLDRAVILEDDTGSASQGVYVYDDVQWRYAMPIEALSASIIHGDDLTIYRNETNSVTLAPTTVVYKSGQEIPTDTITPGVNVIYMVQTPSAGGGGGSGITSILTAGTGVTLVDASTATTATLRSLIGGTNISVTSNGTGGIVIADTTPVATTTVAGLVKVGVGLTVAGDGTVSVNNNGVTTLTGDVTGSGSGSFATTLSTTGVAAGIYTKVTVDVKGRVTAGANPNTLAGYGITDGLPTGGGSMFGNINMTGGTTIVGVPSPVNPTDVANRQYVDNSITAAINGVVWHQAVKAATTADLAALSGLLIIDGYQTVDGDRVLVKNQTSAIDNGIYVASATAWTRATDADAGSELLNTAVLALNGTANSFTQWVNSNSTAPVVGTDAITFSQLQGSGVVYSAAGGLQLDGTIFSISDTGVTAGTYTKLTVNAKGQATAGASLSSGDVSTALGYTPYDGTANPNGFLTSSTVPSVSLTGDVTSSGTGSVLTTTIAPTGVTAGTYTKLTVNAKGQVTLGESLVGTDVTGALGYTPVNVAGDTMTGALNFKDAVAVTAAATTDIGSLASNNVLINGTTTITSLGTGAAGMSRVVQFAASLTLTNSANLILPSGADIVTAANDVAQFTSKGAGVWRCDFYTKANGQAVVAGSSSGSPYSTVQEFDGSASQVALRTKNAVEIANVTSTAPAATQNVYAADGTVTYFTANATLNPILSFFHSSGVNLASAMSVGDVITFAVMITNGATAYAPSSYRVDGGTVTPKWSGGTAPTGGTPNATDVYTFSIIRTSTTFVVLASQTQYK